MDEHGLHAVRAQRSKVALETELGQKPRPRWVDVLGAGFVSGEACLVEEEDAMTALGKKRRRHTSSRATHHDNRVGIVARHVRRLPCSVPPPCGRADASTP